MKILLILLFLSGFVYGQRAYLENGGAPYFDGVNDTIVMAPASMNWVEVNTPHTIMMWLFPVDAATGGLIGQRSTAWPGEGWDYMVENQGSGKANIAGRFVKDGANNYQNSQIGSASAITYNKWQHIAIVYNGQGMSGGNFSLYVNSVKSGASSAGTLAGTVSTVVRTTMSCIIAKEATGPNAEYKGALDNVVVFNRALTDNEIKTYMNRTPKGYIADIKIAYNFNNYSTQVPPRDMSYNGYHPSSITETTIAKGVNGIKRWR